jgi:predicted ABC-class ATPase
MKPHEFWPLTPIEIADWAPEAAKFLWIQAWKTEVLRRREKLPAEPRKIWERGRGEMTLGGLRQLVNQVENLQKARRKNGN